MTLQYIAWKSFYSVGNPSIDRQHQQVIAIVNDLYDAMQSGAEDRAMKPLLDRLVQYTTLHFQQEEAIWREHEATDFAQHKAQHDHMTEKTLALRRDFNSVTGQELLHFLKQWWVNHIQGRDKETLSSLHAAVR